MIQQVIENILNKKNWSSVKFYTATSSRTIFSCDKYEIDSFALYIEHNGYNCIDILDLSKIESMEVKTKETEESNGIPFYKGK